MGEQNSASNQPPMVILNEQLSPEEAERRERIVVLQGQLSSIQNVEEYIYILKDGILKELDELISVDYNQKHNGKRQGERIAAGEKVDEEESASESETLKALEEEEDDEDSDTLRETLPLKKDPPGN